MRVLVPSLVLAALATATAGSGSARSLDTDAFDRMKGLTGTWQAAVQTPEGEPATVSYRVTAHGSALVETLFQGMPHEMVTLYHLENGALVLTHYCAMGNQPHLRLEPASSTKDDLHFVFAGGANVDPRRDVHMHEMRLHFHPDGSADSEWVEWKDGKPDQVEHLFLRSRAN